MTQCQDVPTEYKQIWLIISRKWDYYISYEKKTTSSITNTCHMVIIEHGKGHNSGSALI